jgi:hypothetical protein
MSHTRVLLILCFLLASSARGDDYDHLRARDDLREDDRKDDAYGRAVKRILWQGYRRDVVLRMLTLGAFGGEDIIGIRRVGSGYVAFTVDIGSNNIWHELSQTRPDLSKIRATCYERPIPQQLVERIFNVWCHALRDQRNYRSEAERKMLLYGDSTQIYFFARCAREGPTAANTSNWLGPAAAEMINVGLKIAGHPNQRIFERDLDKALRRAEKRLGLTQRARQ